jgi:putative Ig domain-containing protein/centrosomal CEP192-like protein
VSTTNLPFNEQILYVQSNSQTLYVTNSKDKPLSFQVATVGSNPADFPVDSSNCTAALDPTKSCTVTVSFAPRDVGARSATLSVKISPYDSDHTASVTMSGTGKDPGTAPTVFAPLVQGLKVVSGTADKTAQSVNVTVYDPKCDPELLLTPFPPDPPCKEIAKGYTASIDRTSGLFSAELFPRETKNKDTSQPAQLKTGQLVVVTSTMPTTAASPTGAPPVIPTNRVPFAVQQASYSESLVPWGNVTPTFSTGFVLSQNNNQFSQYNFFLDLNIETSYHLSSSHPNRRVNAFVDTQLTAIPAASCQTTSATGTAATSGSSTTGANCFNSSTIDQSFNSFLSAQKAAVLQGGIYFPIQLPMLQWSYGGNANAAFFGPVVKGGMQTIVNSTQTVTSNSSASSSGTTSTTTTSTLVPSGFYGNWSAGVRLGHLKLWDTWNVAPELLSYIDFTFGRWNSFEQCPSTGCKIDPATGTVTNLSHPFLMGVQGRFKVPDTPLILGFDTITPIAGTGRSNFQFTIGIKTDLACIFNALKSSSTLNSSGSCQKTTQASQSAAPTLSALTIAASSLADATVGSPYSQTITAKGGTSPYSWTAPKGLPTALSIDSSTGQITGTPKEAGNNNFTVTVTDAANPKATASANLTIKVGAAASPALTIATATLPDVTVNSHYSQTISVKGGTAPYSWAQKDLPTWLSLDSSTGEISGTPTAAGNSNFTVTVTDAANPKATATASLTIKVVAK